jgi:uncharacterized membrane protein
MPLLLPTALAGVLIGFALVVVEWRRTRGDVRRTGDRADGGVETVGASTTLQRIPVFICGAIAVVALIGLITNEIRRAPKFHPGLLVALALLILLGSPVLFWRSRWQRTTVGAATVAIAVLAFITGFSIGVLFVPLVIAMVLVCISYLRRPTQVDSPV